MKLLTIGCGSIGRRHALSAQELRLVHAVVDVNDTRAASVAEESGADAHFASVEDALGWEPDGTAEQGAG